MGKLGTLVQFSLSKLYIGGKLTLIHKLTDTLGCGFPQNDLCGTGISCGATFCKANAVLGIPHRKLTVIRFDTGTAVIFLFEQRHDFVHRLLLLESGSYIHSCILGVAGAAEHIVNIVLGKRKSEGCRFYTLRFVYDSNLLLLCREQPNIKEGKLFA